MDDQHSCGKGIAARASVPAQMADVIKQTADVLAMHLTSLDPSHGPSRPEYEAYSELVRLHSETATHLRALAERMAGYHDLPMAEHDMAVLTSAAAREPFAQLVAEEEQLAALLSDLLEEERQILAGG